MFTKKQELDSPDSCLNRAAEDEPVFVLLGRDIAAPATIRSWAAQRIAHHKNARTDGQIQDALNTAGLIEEYQRERNRAQQFVTDKPADGPGTIPGPIGDAGEISNQEQEPQS